MSAKKIVLFFFVILFTAGNLAYAWEKPTHSYLNKGIAYNWWGCFPLDSYLKNNLGIPDGIQSSYNGEQAWNWIADGGVHEDEPMYTRSLNHFHDPLQPWGQAGLSGRFRSSILWAEAINQNVQPDPQYFGNYSWPDARNYFYNALTATDEPTRDTNFANCFRAMGQLMHLVQDAAVPEHTRNDWHVIDYTIEDWVQNLLATNSAQFNQIVNNGLPMTISPSLFSTSVDQAATVPIAGLFDSNTYNGANPNITTGAVGISEYSNANFYSADTITSTHYYYPSLSTSAVPVDETIPNPMDPTQTVIRTYYFKTGDGDSGYLLAGTGYLSDYLNNPQVFLTYLTQIYTNEADFIGSLKLMNFTSVAEIIAYLSNYSWFNIQDINSMPIKVLDGYCYAGYSQKLLPRAVAYSSALLQYFFRGQIDAVEARTTTDTSGNITGITLKVKNNTPGENLTQNSINSSHFVVSYNYQDSAGNTYYGTSDNQPLTAEIQPGNDTSTDTYKYTFNFSNPIPSGATHIHYMLVYRGQLGQEADAVAANVFTPESPLIIDNWERANNDVEWTTDDNGVALNLSDNHYEGTKSMEIDVSDNIFNKIYESQDWNDTDITPHLPIEQDCNHLGNTNVNNPAISPYINPTIAMVRVKYQNLGWYTALFSGNLICEIRDMSEGTFGPGNILATSEFPVSGNTSDTNLPATFIFPGVQTNGPFQFTVTADPLPSGPAWAIALKMGWAYFLNGNYYPENITEQGCCGWGDFYEGFEFVCQIYEGGPLAYRTFSTPIDCTNKTKFRVAIKSGLSGNVVNLIYGPDSTHIQSAKLNLGATPDWQLIEIPISKTTGASFSYFGFALGEGALDETTGESKPNTIYIDQLEAE